MKNYLFFDKILLIIVISLIPVFAFAEVSVTDMTVIDGISGDRFGYYIESIEDLNSDNINDLAVIKYSTGTDDIGSILILFMDEDGSVMNTSEISHDGTDEGLGTCIDDFDNQVGTGFESLAFLGDLDPTDNEYKPILAVGAPRDSHVNLNHVDYVNSGAIYLLELSTELFNEGKVKNCVRIVDNDGNGFNPSNNVYIENGRTDLGFSLVAIDVNNDGIKELITSTLTDNGLEDRNDLWTLFLNNDRTVNRFVQTPASDYDAEAGEIIKVIRTNEDNKIILGSTDEYRTTDEGGRIFILSLDTLGAYVPNSTTKITGMSLGQGIVSGDRFGSGIASVGDMNNDGVNDIIVGNKASDDKETVNDNVSTDSGELFVLFLNNNDTVKETQRISNVSEFERTGISPFESDGLFGQGMTKWMELDESIVFAIGAYDDNAMYLFYINKSEDSAESSILINSSSNSNSGCSDCIPPIILIENEITQNIKVGEPNTVSFSSWEPKGPYYIQLIEIGVGVKDIESTIEDSQARIQVWMGYWFKSDIPNVKEIKVIDPDGIFESSDVIITLAECDQPEKPCLKTEFNYTYAKEPNYDEMIISTSDFYKNTAIEYH